MSELDRRTSLATVSPATWTGLVSAGEAVQPRSHQQPSAPPRSGNGRLLARAIEHAEEYARERGAPGY